MVTLWPYLVGIFCGVSYCVFRLIRRAYPQGSVPGTLVWSLFLSTCCMLLLGFLFLLAMRLFPPFE